ncbi:MAG: hypothetical protein RLZZ337_1549 [Bacteroidota bacterium]
MKNLQYPIQLLFNISTLHNDFTAKDANGRTIAYVKQKMFKLKEDISVFDDESQNMVNYRIKADRWIDFSAAYSITDKNGNELGKIARKGWRSLWKAAYTLVDQHQQAQFKVEEENGWVKVLDNLLSEVPVLGIFTGYFFNPSYLLTNTSGQPIVRLKKIASFWGRKFEITKLGETDEDDDERIMLGLMMMILLERRRG